MLVMVAVVEVEGGAGGRRWRWKRGRVGILEDDRGGRGEGWNREESRWVEMDWWKMMGVIERVKAGMLKEVDGVGRDGLVEIEEEKKNQRRELRGTMDIYKKLSNLDIYA